MFNNIIYKKYGNVFLNDLLSKEENNKKDGNLITIWEQKNQKIFLLNYRKVLKIMKRNILVIMDYITLILIIMHIHSLISFIIEDYSYLNNYDFFDYISFHDLYGVISILKNTVYRDLWILFSFIVYIINIVAVIVKIRDIFTKKQVFCSFKNFFIVLNILFIAFKTIEYNIDFCYLMSV